MRPPAQPRRVAPVRGDRTAPPLTPAAAAPGPAPDAAADGSPVPAPSARRGPEPEPALEPVPERPAETGEPAPDPAAPHDADRRHGAGPDAGGPDVAGPVARPDVVRRDAGEPRDVTTRRRWQPVRPSVVSQGSAARFAERVRRQRHLAYRRIAIGAGVVTVLGAVGWLLLLSPVLALHVEEVELRGQGTVVDPAAVMAVVAPLDRTPLPRIDTVTLRRSVLDVPGVRAAEVARDWPHGLRITVVSREPVAAVPDGREFVLFDVDGVPVGRAPEPPAGLPVVSVPLGDPDARALTAVLSVLRRLPPELIAEIATASAGTRDTVAFDLHDGARVEWGSAEQTALKARVLAVLRAAPSSAGAAVYDVSAPTAPITRS